MCIFEHNFEIWAKIHTFVFFRSLLTAGTLMCSTACLSEGYLWKGLVLIRSTSTEVIKGESMSQLSFVFSFFFKDVAPETRSEFEPREVSFIY